MSWQNGTHGANNGMYGANAANEAVGAYDGDGARPDSAGSPQSPNAYRPQTGPVPVPAYDAYVDPAAAHGWQNAYDATAELPAMSAPSGMGAGGGGGRRRKKRAPGRRGVLVGAVVGGGVGVVSVAALVVGFAGSDASTGGGPGDGGERVRPSAGASVSTGEDSGPPSGADSSDPATAGRSEQPSAGASAGAADGVGGDAPDGSASSAPSGATSEASDSPSQAATATATATGDSDPGNSGSKPGRGQGATKGPK